VLKAVFMHDAAEAYIGDMVKPLKNMIPQFSAVELRLNDAIEAAFGIKFSDFEFSIRMYDRLMLKAEKMEMWPDDPHDWTGFRSIEDAVVDFRFWPPDEAELQFLAMALRLGIKFPQ
jgi:hypothetical protein